MSSTKSDRRIQPPSGNIFPTIPQSAGPGFATLIASALRRGFGNNNGAVKTVVALTGANERAVKNWFAAKNGPSGEHLISLLQHSDDVLETVLLMACRSELVTAKKLVDAKHKLSQIIKIIDEIENGINDKTDPVGR